MTIPSATLRNDYIGSGTTGPFPYTFKIFAASELVVVRQSALLVETTLVLTTDYTSPTGVGLDAGGQITLTVALATGEKLAIYPTVALTQTTDLDNLGAGYLTAIEDRFDRLCRADQIAQRQLDRSLVLPKTGTGVSTTLPVPTATQLIGWNATADGLTNYASIPTGTVSAAMVPVVTAATLALARTAMGLVDEANVKHYGALGDGTTDDSAAIQAAISSGKPVYIPPTSSFYRVVTPLTAATVGQIIRIDGTVKFVGTNTLTLLACSAAQTVITGLGTLQGPGTYIDNVTGVNIPSLVRLSGAGSSVRGLTLRDHVTAGVIINGVADCNVHDVTIYGGIPTYVNPQHYGILAYIADRVSIQRCRSIPVGTNACVQLVNTVACSGAIIQGCIAKGVHEKLLYGDGDYHVVVGNECEAATTNFGDGIRIIGKNCTITGNTVKGFRNGGISLFNSSDSVCAGNSVTDCQAVGIFVGHIGGSTTPLSGNVIVGNVIRMKEFTGTETIDSGISIRTVATVTCSRSRIADNVIYGADRSGTNQAGIWLQPSAGSVYNDFEIVDNVIVECGYEGIEVAQTNRLLIQGNRILNAGFLFSPINSIFIQANNVDTVVKQNLLLNQFSRRNTAYTWTLSGTGTNEYYLRTAASGNPGALAAMTGVLYLGASLAAGTVGALAAGAWGFGNTDALGYSTVYVRLSDGTDPDTKAIDSVELVHCSSPIDVASGGANERCVIEGNTVRGAATPYSFNTAQTHMAGGNRWGLSPLAGTFTTPTGAANLTIANDNVLNDDRCRITIEPMDVNAATIMQGAKFAYINLKTTKSLFQVQTQDASNFLVAGKFSYRIDV